MYDAAAKKWDASRVPFVWEWWTWRSSELNPIISDIRVKLALRNSYKPYFLSLV